MGITGDPKVLVALEKIKYRFNVQLKRLIGEQWGAASDLADVCGLKRGTVSNLLLSKTLPRLDTFLKICLYFDVDPNKLLGVESKESREHLRMTIALARIEDLSTREGESSQWKLDEIRSELRDVWLTLPHLAPSKMPPLGKPKTLEEVDAPQKKFMQEMRDKEAAEEARIDRLLEDNPI